MTSIQTDAWKPLGGPVFSNTRVVAISMIEAPAEGRYMAGGHTSDSELFEAWSSGRRDAGNKLIERHFDLVHRFFHNKVGNEIEDLVQQTFLGCLEARERFAGRASFKTFVLGIARNVLFLHYRRGRRARLDFRITSVHDLGTSPSGALARLQDERLLTAAFRRVPLEAQVVLELAYWEDLDGADIAQVLNVPLNTAYSRLRRAREALRERLEAMAPDHPGSAASLEKLDRVAVYSRLRSHDESNHPSS